MSETLEDAVEAESYQRKEILGKRIDLLEIQPEDLEILLPWRNSASFIQNCLGHNLTVDIDGLSAEIHRSYNNDKFAQFIAWSKEDRPIGTNWIYNYNSQNGTAYTTTFVNPEDRYANFYGIEMFLLACDYMFNTMNCRKVYSEVHGDNTDSSGIFEKLGLSQEATLKDHTLKQDGSFSDLLIFALYKEQFNQSDFVKRIIAETE